MEALEEKFLEKVAKEKGISKPKAAKIIDKCILQTAANLNVPYSDVYSKIYNEEYMSKCLKDVCSTLELDQCRKSCQCFEFEGKCVSKRFPDAEIINRDPDDYVTERKISTERLDKMVKLAAYLYHNYTGGGLTDNSFDAMEHILKKRLKIKGRLYEKIGAEPVERIRIKLPYPLPSLKKVKPGTIGLHKFLTNHKKIAWSLKLDGVSGMVVYKNQKIIGIYTRGNGEIGGNVLHLKKYIKFPKPSKDYVIRGEFVLSKKIWSEKYSGEYSNARSFVSGKINSGFVSPSLPDINFIAYEIMKIGGEFKVPPPSQAFKILESEGFNTVENGTFEDTVVFDLMELYKRKYESAEYSIDGIVITADISKVAIRGGSLLETPGLSVAFKMQLKHLIRDSKIINVEWNVSRYGKYVPKAIYEAVYIDGVRLHKATAYNAAHIRDWSMGIGTKIKIVRSGSVIPIIKDVTVDLSIIPIMPTKYLWHWTESEKEIFIDEIENNRDVQIKRIIHFFSTIGVPKIGPATAKKMWNLGMKTPKKVASSTSTEFQKMEFIGKKTGDFLYDKIHEQMRITPIDRYLVASTTFKSGLGRKTAKKLFEAFPNILTYSEAEIRDAFKKKKVKGFGAVTINKTAKNIPKFRKYLYSFDKEDIEESIRYNKRKLADLKAKGYNLAISGKTFVLTGFMGHMDYDIEDYIYDNRGDFSGVVTSQTEAVIAKDILDISEKMEDAYSLGVKVLTLTEFKERYSILL